MQQILALMTGDADSAGLTAALGDGAYRFFAPNVLVADGDETKCAALKALSCAQAVLSDDDSKTATGATDMTTLDIAGMSDMVSKALGLQVCLDEPTSLAVAGWMFGLSDQYATWKSDRPRDGESWDMPGGCIAADDAPFSNA
jgi:hypothetical protein